MQLNAVLDQLLITFIAIHAPKYKSVYGKSDEVINKECSIAWLYYFGSDHTKLKIRNDSFVDSATINEIIVSIEIFMSTIKHVTENHKTKDLVRKLNEYQSNKIIIKS